ncbi:hypothetical protein LCGC14_2918900, partial [marine sediment metagenome]
NASESTQKLISPNVLSGLFSLKPDRVIISNPFFLAALHAFNTFLEALLLLTATRISPFLAKLSMAFGANNALIRQRIPSGDITPDEFLKLKFSHAVKDVYTKILSARLYFHVNPAQYDVIDVDNVVS